MSFLLAFLAMIGEKLGKVCNKYNFKKNKSHPIQELFINFSTMFLIIMAFILIYQKQIKLPNNSLILILILMIIISYFQNIFEFKGLEKKDLAYREPISNLQSLFASFLAYILFPSEREIKYLIGIILAVIILYFINKDKKHKLNFDLGTLYIFGAIICSAILVNIYKFGLNKILPEYLYLTRIIGILILLLIFQRKNIFKKQKTKNQFLLGILGGIFYSIGFLARLYSIIYLGLNMTILILLLSPVFVYLFSYIILKENIKKEQLIGSFLILLIIIGTLFI